MYIHMSFIGLQYTHLYDSRFYVSMQDDLRLFFVPCGLFQCSNHLYNYTNFYPTKNYSEDSSMATKKNAPFWRCMSYWIYRVFSITTTLQEINISLQNGILKMIFLFPRWDMLISWRVLFLRDPCKWCQQRSPSDLIAPKKGASQEHRAWPLAQCLGARFLNDVPWVGQMVEARTSQNCQICQFPKRGGFVRDQQKYLCVFMSVHKVRLIYDLRHLYTWFKLTFVWNMIWFFRSFQIPLLYLQISVLFLYHRGWNAPKNETLDIESTHQNSGNFRSIIIIIVIFSYIMPFPGIYT